MTRYYYDSEFIDNGQTIDLISVGIVAEDGRELYLQSCEVDETKASDWVRDHVLSRLAPNCSWRTRYQIRKEIEAFLDPEQYGKPEIYAWYGGYDFVAFCQLWGPMMQLPPNFPYYFRELQRELDICEVSDAELPKQEIGLHNALEDAKHIKMLWESLCTET